MPTEILAIKEEWLEEKGHQHRLNPKTWEAKERHHGKIQELEGIGPVSLGLVMGTGVQRVHMPFLRYGLPERWEDEDGGQFFASDLEINPALEADLLNNDPHLRERHLRKTLLRTDQQVGSVVTEINPFFPC